MKLYLVGLGPGGQQYMTLQAQAVLQGCDLIVGYQYYIDLLRQDFPDKAYYSSPMKQEVGRCRHAIEETLSGKEVAVVSSGDAGIYGMAGLVYQLAQDYPEFEIEMVPGITAATSGAAVLGAPLMNDFAVISLSDLLTPWEVIQKRIRLASEAGLVLCIYNPSSKKRATYLHRACQIVMQYRNGETVCGVVRQIGRDGQTARVLSLEELAELSVDMFTTVFIGNEDTVAVKGKMLTARGYALKEEQND